jgi:membrane protein
VTVDRINARAMGSILKESFAQWREDNASRLAAALAYYSVLSLAPLLILLVAFVGLVYGSEEARAEIAVQAQEAMGEQGAEAVTAMLENTARPGAGILAALIGFALLIFGATGVFTQLQGALNQIWDVEPEAGGLKAVIRARVFSFFMILGIGFLLLASLALSAAVGTLTNFFADNLPIPGFVLALADLAVSFILVGALFALVFRVLPDAKVAWGDVWIGALFTAFLFVIAKIALGYYLSNSAVGSAYGAAGSLVVILVFIYYSAQILLFGAEFTQVYANRYGSHIRSAEETEEEPERAAAA